MLLASCSKTRSEMSTPNENESFKSKLIELQKGYAFEGTIEKYNGYYGNQVDENSSPEVEQEHNWFAPIEVFSNSDSYHVKKWNYGGDQDKPSKETGVWQNSYYKSKEKDGQEYIVSSYLTIGNKVEESFMSNSSNKLATWDEGGYRDFFMYFTAEDFEQDKENKNKYNLIMGRDDLLQGYVALARQLYGIPALEPEAFYLTLGDDDRLSFAVTYKSENLWDLGIGQISITGDFTSIGDSVKVPSPETLTGDEDQIFVTAMNNLKSHSFHLESVYDQSDFGAGKKNTYSADITPNQIKFNYVDKEDAYNKNYLYFNENGKVQGAAKLGDNYYRDRDPYEGKVEDMIPSFDISSLFFTYNAKSDIYNWKKENEARLDDAESFSVFYGSQEVDNLKIKIKGTKTKTDSVIFTFVTEAKRTITLTYTSIGSIKDTVNVTDIKSNCDDVPWSTLIAKSPKKVADAKNKLGSLAVLDSVPTVGGTYADILIDSTEGFGNDVSLGIVCDSVDKANELKESYAKKIQENNGFTIDTTKNKEGHIYLTKTSQIEGKETKVNLNLWVYTETLTSKGRFYIYVSDKEDQENQTNPTNVVMVY